MASPRRDADERMFLGFSGLLLPFGVLGFALVVAAISFLEAGFNRRAVETVGDLRELRDCSGASRYSPPACYVSVLYWVGSDRLHFEGELEVSEDAIQRVGPSELKVFYDERNPDRIAFARKEPWRLQGLAVLIAGLGLVLLVVEVRKIRRERVVLWQPGGNPRGRPRWTQGDSNP